MANILKTEKQIAVISALAEGSSIRSIERMTGINRNTIMNLGVRIGKGCARILDEKMRGLTCENLQFDELVGFVGKRLENVTEDDSPELGDVWTFVALDADTKVIPAYRVGKRTSANTKAFVKDVAARIVNKPQVSTDGFKAYVDAMEAAFGAEVDYGMIVKNFANTEQDFHKRKGVQKVVYMDKSRVMGHPKADLMSTSYVERVNGTIRQHMRRLTRSTYAFSKKLENFEAAVALNFAYYNFVRGHKTLSGATPAMAAGVERSFWSVGDLVEVTR